MVASLQPLMYQDLLDLPDDNKRRELLGGDLLVSPAPRRSHQFVSKRLASLLLKYLAPAQVGYLFAHPVDLLIDPYNVLQPDLILIEKSQFGIDHPEGTVVGPPDMVIEIVSPSSQRTGRVGKMKLCALRRSRVLDR